MHKDRAPTWNPEATATYWINRASRALSRHLDARLRPFGFALGQFPVLRALAGGEALSQAELARIAQVEQPSMAETLARMTRDGVVERQPDPHDGRASLVTLTRRSRQRLTGARAALVEAEAGATAGLSAAALTAICDALQRIVRNVDEAERDGAPGAAGPAPRPRRVRSGARRRAPAETARRNP